MRFYKFRTDPRFLRITAIGNETYQHHHEDVFAIVPESNDELRDLNRFMLEHDRSIRRGVFETMRYEEDE